MTAETESPPAVLEVVVCPSCGTLYRRTAERIWCPNCSADAPEGIDLGGLIDGVQVVQEGLDALVQAIADGLDAEMGDVLVALRDALKLLATPAQARPPVARPSRRGPNSAPVVAAADATAADPEQDQGGAGVDAAAAESADYGKKDTTGSPPTAAAAEPETGA